MEKIKTIFRMIMIFNMMAHKRNTQVDVKLIPVTILTCTGILAARYFLKW